MQIVLMYSDRSRAVLYLLSNFINKTAFTVFRLLTKGHTLLLQTTLV